MINLLLQTFDTINHDGTHVWTNVKPKTSQLIACVLLHPDSPDDTHAQKLSAKTLKDKILPQMEALCARVDGHYAYTANDSTLGNYLGVYPVGSSGVRWMESDEHALAQLTCSTEISSSPAMLPSKITHDMLLDFAENLKAAHPWLVYYDKGLALEIQQRKTAKFKREIASWPSPVGASKMPIAWVGDNLDI